MKKINILLISLIGMPFMAQAQTIQQWEQCVDKLEHKIDVSEVGNIGYEQEIKKRCGTRPIAAITAANLEGSLPYDVVQAVPWKARFQQLTGKGYHKLQISLTTSSAMQREGDWVIGSGYDPRGGGASKAAIAINTRTAKVLAVYAEEGSDIKFYGFDANSKDVPEKLWHWVAEETGAG